MTIDPYDIEALRDLVASANSIVAFTGAGISTESGVPDFRSAGSPWLTNRPIDFRDFVQSAEARREAWRRKFTMDDLYRDAAPNRGHRALARLVAVGRSPGIITQNIDGLHQAAGTPDEAVVELHGNGTYARCIACGLRHELAEIRPGFEATGEPPACRECGAPVKSATISFGQQMPAEAMRRAEKLMTGCDLFLAVGSSLVVYPAAGFPRLAAELGIPLVILNREPTELDPLATLVLHGDAGPVLDAIAATH